MDNFKLYPENKPLMNRREYLCITKNSQGYFYYETAIFDGLDFETITGKVVAFLQQTPRQMYEGVVDSRKAGEDFTSIDLMKAALESRAITTKATNNEITTSPNLNQSIFTIEIKNYYKDIHIDEIIIKQQLETQKRVEKKREKEQWKHKVKNFDKKR